MTDKRTILITGATGQQGGAVCRELAGKGFELRVMTRKPEGDAAKTLARMGVDVVRGDLDMPETLVDVIEGAWGVFAVQNTWEAGVEKEEKQGKSFARLAREHGVQHFVYTSVGSAHRDTGIPHFDNKWRIEETIREMKFPSYVILRPVFFMENLTSPWFFQNGKLNGALNPETKLQMIAVEDIGRVGAWAFTHADELNGEEIDLAGDVMTLPEAAAEMGKGLGTTVEFVRLPIETVREQSEDFALMLEWFERVGYDVDIPALEKRFWPMTKFSEWVRENVRS